MDARTLDQLHAALEAFGEDLAPRVEELAQRSSAGTLTAKERQEYEHVVRLNDKLGLLKLEAEQLWTIPTPS